MLRTALLALALGIFPLAALAAEPPSDARRLLLSGKYAEAAEIYQARAPQDPASAVGLSRCLAAEGKYDEAAAVLTAASADHAVIQAELALLAFDRGDYPEAEKHAEAALRLEPSQLQARWVRGELLKNSGRLEEAEKAYLWLVTHYNEHDVRDAESLRWIGLAAAQVARWKRLGKQFDFLVNELYPDALKAEPGYWPAHYEAGRLFLEKHNQADAAREFKAALALNPSAAEVHAASALVALENREIEQAEQSLRRALEINSRLLAAWHVKADLAWANFQPAEAADLLRKYALPLNPASEATLGRLAACFVLREGVPQGVSGTEWSKLAEGVAAHNTHAGEFYFTCGSWLEARSKLPEAEYFFKEAAGRMPQLLGSHAELGLLSMRAADEEQARKRLEEAFQADPFNVRVKNSLEVLDVLDGMEKLETRHCILRFDGQADRLLSRYAARVLDEVYPELCKQFGFQPPKSPLVEVFFETKGVSGQQWFSARMIGLPYLGAVAASTGHMLAMTSPNDRVVAKKFNWARVLKHELVHVITLQQTHFNIPHWYTEALAVWSEGHPRPQEWNELLVARVAENRLFNLDTLNFGFTRPTSSDDWQLAYCQAELYLEYMLDGRNEQVIRDLLAAYRDGLATPEAIRRVFQMPIEQFERGYSEYLKRLVAGMAGLEPPSQESFPDLLTARREKPDDPQIAAKVAEGYLRRGAYEEALTVAAEVLKKQPKHALATYVMARLELRGGRPEKALELLETSLDLTRPDAKCLNLLAGLKLKAEAYAEAARLYEMGARYYPCNLQWLRSLARVHLLVDNQDGLLGVLQKLAAADPDDLMARKKLAEMALAAKDYQAAEDWANQAVEIDVSDAGAHCAFAESLVGRHNYRQAIEEFETAIALDPNQPRPRFALADACLQAGDARKARQVLADLVKIAPDYPGAELLLESVLEDLEKNEREP
ncbi:MAG: tetratricopeptide repeat protein [Pirellulales bacterium]|nr:tetratricopeptide repeat protein [Pirellulales bacterium]